MKHKILLIGAGQLGSRHLQGLAKSHLETTVDIVDINAESRRLAEQQFLEISSEEVTIGKMKSTPEELPHTNYDLVIIATNADIRASITQQLLSSHSASNIIFEKVAFQSPKQFEKTIELLNDNGIKGWVNCPRRYFEGYNTLANMLKNNGPIVYNVNGTDWGLACNSVHYIDLFFLLSGSHSFEITEEGIEDAIFPSKRKGFIEFFGYYKAISNNGSRFQIKCNHLGPHQQKAPTLIEIFQGDKCYRIEELSNKISLCDSLQNEIAIKVIYQSSLTGIQAEDIILKGHSKLPTIHESYREHAPFLKMLINKYERISGSNIKLLPIT